MKRMQTINIKEVEYLAFRYAREFLAFNEPIPDFTSRFPNKLESCLAVPFQSFAQRDLYRGLTGKAAILFYLMIKNHPFQNGNKRIALTTLMLFFYKNKQWLKIDNREFYNFSIWVAQSPSSLKTEVLKAVEKFFRNHLVSLK